MLQLRQAATTAALAAFALLGSAALTLPAIAADAAKAPTAAAAQPKAGRVEPGPAGVDKHLASLHAKFGITAAQETQWTAFAQVMRDNAKMYDQMAKERVEKMKSLNAVDDLRSFQEMAQAHADGLKRLTASFQGVYDAMTPEQKKHADSVFHDYGQRQHAKHKKTAS